MPNAIGHVCLNHGRAHVNRSCSGGFKSVCPDMIDMFAFIPPFAFHIAMTLLLDKLTEAGQHSVASCIKSELRTQSQFSLVTDNNGLLIALWKSSFAEFDPLAHCFFL